MKRFSLPVIPILAFSMVFGVISPVFGLTIVSFSDVDRLDKSGGGSWSVNGTSTESLLAGNASSSIALFETAVLIDIAPYDTEIGAASSITFNIAYDAVLGTGQDVTAYFFGTNSSTINSIGGQTFHDTALAGSSAGTILVGDFSAPGVASYDATSIVQSLTGFDYAAILLTSGLTSDTSSTAHDISFYDDDDIGSQPNGGAYLTIVPEPSSVALVLVCGLSTLVMTARWRRPR